MTFNPDNPNEHEEVKKSTVNTNNGVTFKNFKTESKVDALAVLPDKRIVMTGTPSIAIMEGSWKFGKQIQFQLTTPKEVEPRVEERNDYSNYNRIEIDIPFEQGKKMINELYKELNKVEEPKPKTNTEFYYCVKCDQLMLTEILPDHKMKCTKCLNVRDRV